MNRFRPAGSQLLAILTGILAVAVPAARAGLLETTIDLNYTYQQTHLGDDITSGTSVEQQYNIVYETAVTPLFDMLASITLDLQNTSEDQEADTSKIAPTLELTFTAPKAQIRFSYDAAVDRTDEFRDTSASESYATAYLVEFEVTPDYWPEARVKFERKRDFEDQSTEAVGKIFTLDLRKEIGDLSLEFDYEYEKMDDALPSSAQTRSTAWGGMAAYQSTVWWDMDVDLTYEIAEKYTEKFTKGIFTDEDKEYIHNIQARLQKSLVLTPRLKADFEYSYDFEQDLLFLEMDYSLDNDFALGLTYDMFSWLELTADYERSIQKTVNVRPEDDDEEVEDFVTLAFDLDRVRWLSIAGQAEWSFEEIIESGTGATINQKDEAAYELSVQHRWGNWWTLTASGSSEYEYKDAWLTDEDSGFVVDADIILFEGIALSAGYNIQRSTQWEERSPLKLSQSKKEEAEITFDFERDFSDMIMFSFAHQFAINWETEISEVMSEDELVELTEDTKVRLVLVDFIRDMELEGEITRKATDTKDDEEPMLVDISYALKLNWQVDDINVAASYQYDDNGDTFDESSLNSQITWDRDTFQVSGEYQFDQTYSDEIDEQRRLNLNMSMLF